MPKITISLSDPAEQEELASGLRLMKHNVSVLPPEVSTASPKELVQRLMDEKSQVAILEYVAEDAASVKMLQAATDYASFPKFIFVLPEDVSASHILMAVNEGAAAIVQKPIDMDALNNYIERAVSGPSRFRFEAGRESNTAAELEKMGRTAKVMKVQLASQRKLISYLLSTPSSSQQRTVMIVSDSAYQRDSLKKLFEEHNFHVYLAQNPEEGLNVALEEKPRVVISDLEMEGKNGVEFCHDLKIVNKFMPCFFVICTANSEKIETVMAPGNGVDGCVLKPSNESGNQDLMAVASMGLLL